MQGGVLIIDDDDIFAQTLALALTRRGYRASSVNDGAAALALAETQPFDAVILDLRLGAESGLHLIEPLRARQPSLRILLLTGYASIATAVNAVKQGAVEYLTKPARIGLIVSTLLGKHEDAEQDVAPEEWLTVKGLEWEYLQRALAENGGNITATARALKMHRRTLQRKLGKKRPQDREP